MSLARKLVSMFAISPRTPAKDYIGPDIQQALQRNERASERVRAAMIETRDSDRMTETFRNLVGKM